MLKNKSNLILIQGGGDLASGVAAVLHRHEWKVVITEIADPLVVRRKVAFAESVWEKRVWVEGIEAALAESDQEVIRLLSEGVIPVVVDSEAKIAERIDFKAIIDARMLKRYLPKNSRWTAAIIGLGPGFVAPENCAAVIETNRGEKLGEIIWKGSAQADTGIPGIVEGRGLERVLYSPAAGVLKVFADIGVIVKRGQLLADVAGVAVQAPFDGVVRGMLREGISVEAGTKLGDVDPRINVELAYQISDKALIVGESVLRVLESLE